MRFVNSFFEFFSIFPQKNKKYAEKREKTDSDAMRGAHF